MAYALDLIRPTRQRRTFGLLDLFALARQRRALARLSDAQLQDLGLSRHAAQEEADRPMWDVPCHWMR